MTKENWKKLKACLKEELILTKRSLKDHKKDKLWHLCSKDSETIYTLRWVLDELYCLEANGELL